MDVQVGEKCLLTHPAKEEPDDRCGQRKECRPAQDLSQAPAEGKLGKGLRVDGVDGSVKGLAVDEVDKDIE